MSKVIEFNTTAPTVKNIIEWLYKNQDRILDITTVITTDNHETKTAWSEKSLKELCFDAKFLDMAIGS